MTKAEFSSFATTECVKSCLHFDNDWLDSLLLYQLCGQVYAYRYRSTRLDSLRLPIRVRKTFCWLKLVHIDTTAYG